MRTACRGAAEALFVPSAVLADKVSHVLENSGVLFGRREGLLTVSSTEMLDAAASALRNLSASEKRAIRVGSADLAGLMRAPNLERYLALRETAWFDRALREDGFTSWFQPIVDLSTGLVFAHECLIRYERDGHFRNGADIVAAAMARREIHAFDAHARQLAIREGGLQHEPGTYLFVNFFPSSIYDPEYCLRSTMAALRRTSIRPSEVVFEVVESEQVEDAGHLRRICDFYRREGFGFALDDVGTGSSSMNMMAELRPDFIKLDKSLVRAAEEPMKGSIIRKFVDLAREFHINVIAEGIESAEMSTRMQSLGIALMQGWHFGRPAPQMRCNTGAALAMLMQHLDGHLEAEILQTR
jgi:EAL domain-containing protein (putative c-di-GMP-specific phosphodiesterase class I)